MIKRPVETNLLARERAYVCVCVSYCTVKRLDVHGRLVSLQLGACCSHPWRSGEVWYLRSTGSLQCFDVVGWVIWPVKTVPEMTYKVSSGTSLVSLQFAYSE